MDTLTTEEKIKKAALREFAQYGMAGARVDRIAQKGKINKAMIYYHYKSKEGLYESVLSEIYKNIYSKIMNILPKDDKPDEQFKAIIGVFIDYMKTLDQDYIRMMLRELASGGKFVKKLMLPGIILPMVNLTEEIFKKGIKQGIFKEVIPHITFIQILGSILFSNAIRITLSDTDLGKLIFQEDFFDAFKINLLSILKTGILAR